MVAENNNQDTIASDIVTIESCIYSSRYRSFSTISEKDESSYEPISDDDRIKDNNGHNQLTIRKEKRKVSREEALVLLLQMNTTYTKVPSCFSNLMEDRIEAHKLLGIRTTNDLAAISLSLSKIVSPLSTGHCIKRRFVDVHSHKSLSTDGQNCSKSITIMSWNVLSQAIGFHMDKFATCSLSDLSWSTRKWKLIHELAQYNPGILCLQEVDKFYFIHKLMQKVGYDGKFVPKPDSPANYLPSNTGPDGCAIFYDTNKFTLINHTSYVINVCNVKSNQVALICVLKYRISGKIFIVATTHLKARKSELLSKLRNEQAIDLLAFIHGYMDAKGYDKNQTPIMITGDFNGERCEPFYKIMTETLSSAYDKISHAKENDNNLLNKTHAHSNWTRRMNEEEIKQTIDYMFYDANQIKVDALLELSSNQLNAPIPNALYPSDHLSLVAKFSFI